MAADNIFEDCVFSVVQSGEFGKSYVSQIKESISTGGGECRELDSNGIIDLKHVTHIISVTSDFPQYMSALEQRISVVTPGWVTHSLLKNRQAPIRQFTPDPNLFYSNVVLSCGDIPSGDKNAIIGAVLALGGMESNSLTKMVTHICALSMDHEKCQQALEKDLKAKIVLPHWFDDCLKLGKRIDETPYLLPNPEIFRRDPEETVPIPSTPQLQGATSSRPENFPIPTDSPRRSPLTVFKSKRVMLSEDLRISHRLRGIIEDLIDEGGGKITGSVHNATMFVCHWRESRDYVFASRAGIDVGNLSWLYHLITHNCWTNPMRMLLHYPLPRGGIPGFENFIITLSNYGGEARIYLENLVKVSGGEFTKSMKQENTHLITARAKSEKCNAAAEWGIEMINHLWLEESYAKCKVQKLTDPRYTHFPPRTNLGEIAGRTQVDPEVVQKMFFPKDPTPNPEDTKPTRRAAMREKDRNSAASRNGNDVSVDGKDNEAAPEEALKSKKIEARRSRTSILSDASTPASNRRISLGKENDTPSSTNSRSAKDKALNQIHGLAPDIALYEKEKKRRGPVWGGERAANKIEKRETQKRKSGERSSSPAVDTEDDPSDGERAKKIPKTKSTLKPALPPAEIRLMITGYKEWIGNLNKEDYDKRKLRDLGILVTQDHTNCTHLAAPAMVRTQKFLCALAMGPTIVSTDFIDTCVQKNAVPDVDEFLLKDKTNEKKFGLKLKDVLTRARANKRSLLRRIPVYCTAEIANGPETYKSIVKANGGEFFLYTGKGGAMIKPTKPEEDDIGPEPVYLLTGPRPEERKLWPKFTEMAENGNMVPKIVHSEWLLDVAMSQQLKSGDPYLAIED